MDSSTTSCTTQTIQGFIGGFSYGEVMIIFLLILIFTQLFFSKLVDMVLGAKIDTENGVLVKYNDD